MRLHKKLWDKGWYFALIAKVSGNAINWSTPLNVAWKVLSDLKKKTPAEQKRSSFREPFRSIICRAVAQRFWIRDTQPMWNIFKLVVLHYIRRKYSKYFLQDWKKDITSFYCENKKRQFKHSKKNKKNIWTRLPFISKHEILIVELLLLKRVQ